MLFCILSGVLIYISIIQPLQAAERAELLYQRYENQWSRLKEENRRGDQILADYAHYGNAFQKIDENIPDRLRMLEVLESDLFPFCVSVSSVSISEDRMELHCVLEKGTELPMFIKQAEAHPFVRHVSIHSETTGEETRSRISAGEKFVTIAMTVYFQMEKGEQHVR